MALVVVATPLPAGDYAFMLTGGFASQPHAGLSDLKYRKSGPDSTLGWLAGLGFQQDGLWGFLSQRIEYLYGPVGDAVVELDKNAPGNPYPNYGTYRSGIIQHSLFYEPGYRHRFGNLYAGAYLVAGYSLLSGEETFGQSNAFSVISGAALSGEYVWPSKWGLGLDASFLSYSYEPASSRLIGVSKVNEPGLWLRVNLAYHPAFQAR